MAAPVSLSRHGKYREEQDMVKTSFPAFPYGAVYYRRSNPPRQDWARDYATAAEDGHTLFRHWFLWSAIETAPGAYDWDVYDRQLDLAAEHGIKTIIAEMLTVAPEFLYREYAHARFETRGGERLGPTMHGSCAVGGAPGLCLDHADYRAKAERFLRALVTRYRDHPAMGGYDVWNECNYPGDVCYCPATQDDFRAWLKARYGDLETLSEAWHRYGFADWRDVTPPRSLSPYPDSLDWLQFRIDNAYEQMDWRIATIRELDPDHLMTAHGIAGTLTALASNTRDDWLAASKVDSYGYTWGSSRHGDEPWKQVHAVDLVRAAARGKRFWHAEAYGGPLWMQSVMGRPREDGRIPEPEDIRYWDLISFMCGATGLLYLRWRPLLDGPLFGAFGPYGMDGSRTDRSEMASRIGKWVAAPEQAQLWRSRPVKGQVGILVVPETQLFLYAQQGDSAHYARSLEGAYRGFFDINVQADWVRIEDIDAYERLYLPIPVSLSPETVTRLRNWVEAGGRLVVEGCPGYFDARGHVGPVQPAMGLDELLGVREHYVEFTPDLLDDLRVIVDGTPVWGGLFLQAYAPTSGTPVGWYEGVGGRANGQVAVVDHSWGLGRTRLIGTMVGYGHGTHVARGAGRDACAPGGNHGFFRELMAWYGVTPDVRTSDPALIARLYAGKGGTYLWIANPTHRARPVRLSLSGAWGPFTETVTLWGASATVDGRDIMLTAPARDITILALQPAIGLQTDQPMP
jgi:beta-galactosidase